ncbi:MAG: tRNA pseudouridine(13) synthase TruD [Planctomycetota bacterium]
MSSGYGVRRILGDLPPLGGRIKALPEDFVVEELPAYEPCGSGGFLYLWVQKRDFPAERLAREVGHRLGIRPQDVGIAGLKDRRAVSRQWISVPDSCSDRLTDFDDESLKILAVNRHGNKLRAGHTRGNRFQIRIRDLPGESVGELQRRTESLRVKGMPNAFGPQRFGHGGETARLGWALVRGERPRLNPWLKKLACSAVQSDLFNSWLDRRIADGLERRALEGDVLAHSPRGGMFVCSDPASDQPRLDRLEVVPAGPMFGQKMLPASSSALERERELLLARDLDAGWLPEGSLFAGTRRRALVPVPDLAMSHDQEGVTLGFSLPSGSYATVLLAELLGIDSKTSGGEILDEDGE